MTYDVNSVTGCLGQTLDQCGGVDILVSNAAVNPFFGNIMESTQDVWDKVRPNGDHFRKARRSRRIV